MKFQTIPFTQQCLNSPEYVNPACIKGPVLYTLFQGQGFDLTQQQRPQLQVLCFVF